MHHLAAQKAAANLTTHPHTRAQVQGFLVRRIKVDEAQHAGVAAVVHRHMQLPARPERDLAVRYLRLDLHRLAVPRVFEQGDARLVLVAQGQVQRQIDVAAQAHFFERTLR